MFDENLAMMVVLVTLILTVGFTSIARQFAKPLARFLESRIREEGDNVLPARELERIHDLLENVDSRLHLLEERQGFYEALGAAEVSGRLNRPAADEPPPRTD